MISEFEESGEFTRIYTHSSSARQTEPRMHVSGREGQRDVSFGRGREEQSES